MLRRVAKAVGLGICLLVLAVSGLSLAFFVVANGLTFSACCLATVPLISAFFAFSLPRAHRGKRWTVVAAAALVLLDGAFIATRLSIPPSTRVRYCDRGDCRGSPPLLARLLDEGETALSGLELTGTLGMIAPPEREALEGHLRAGYGELRSSPEFAGSPNALLIRGSERRVRTLLWEPEGSGRVPALVFLHGYVGLFTPYLHALAAPPLGEHAIIVAPLLDSKGHWWSEEGEAVLRAVLERHLPDRVDRERVYLVGMSNGSVGVARLAQREAVRRHLAGAIMISGLSSEVEGSAGGLPGLVLAGSRDSVFPFSRVEANVAALRRARFDLELARIEGDHFIIFSQQRRIAETIDRWMQGQPSP